MRIVAFILSTLIATGLLIGGAFFLFVNSDDKNPVWLSVATIAMTIFIYGPLIVGSFRAYWDVTGSNDSRRYFRRVLLIVIGLEALAAILTVVYAVTTSASASVPVVLIGSGAILTVAAPLIGRAFYSYDAAHRPPPSGWIAIEPSQIRHRIIAVAITFAGVLVLGLLGLGFVNIQFDDTLDVTEVLSFALSFAFIVAGAVCVFSTAGWNHRIRDVTDKDPARLRKVARVVIRNKRKDLDDPDLVAAARYASVISVILSFQLAYLVLLYAGIALQQVSNLRNGSVESFSLIIIIFLVAALLVILPLQIIRIRRARRYAREHRAEIDAPAPTSAA
jgi:hypothetical protein